MAGKIQKWFRWAFDLVGLPANIEFLVKLLGAPSVLGVLTTYLGAQVANNMHWAIFAGSGVFAFSAIGLYFITLQFRQSVVLGKIRIREVRIGQVFGDAPDRILMVLEIVFHNHADCDVFYKTKKAFLTIEGQSNQDAKIGQAVGCIFRNSDATLQTAGVRGIPKNSQMTGKLSLEVHYGRAEDDLKYALDIDGGLLMTAHYGADNHAEFTAAMRTERIEHKRAV